MRKMQRHLAWLLALVMTLCLGAVTASAAPEATVDETVLLDNDLATVTVTDYDPDGDWGPTFELLLENKSSQTLRIRLENSYVNDVMCDAFLSESVPAGKKVYSTLEWENDDLANSGIDHIETAGGLMEIRDDASYDTLAVVEVSWSVNVTTDTPAVMEYASESGFAPVTVLNEAGLEATVVDYLPTGSYDGSPLLVFYLKNDTDRIVRFDTEDVSVNGFMCDPYWGTVVMPGKVAYSACEWYEDDLAASHIDTFEDVEFTMTATDDDTWDDLASASATLDLTAPAAPAAPAEEPEAPAEEPQGGLSISVATDGQSAEQAPAADEPAADTAGEETVLGRFDGDTYTNSYFGVSFTPPVDGWTYTPEAEMADAMGIEASSYAEITQEQIDQALGAHSSLTIMSAQNESGLQYAQMQIQAWDPSLSFANGMVVDMTKSMMEESLPGATVEKTTYTLDGEQCDGLFITYTETTSNVDVVMYMDIVMPMKDNYVGQIMLCTAMEDGTADLAAAFGITK